MPLLIDLFFFTLVISLYDLRTRRIPNWATIPVVIAGLIVHFPGTVTLLVATAFIVALGFVKQTTIQSVLAPIKSIISLPVSQGYVMGMGDVKLWLACIWAVPKVLTLDAVLAMVLGWILMSLISIVMRALRHKHLSGAQSPVAWASFLFTMILLTFQWLRPPF
jgi:prepilin signal peptidase PulO-like enzyme (type II secretory pathway)